MSHFDPLDKTSKCKLNHWETSKQTVPGKAGPKEVVRRVQKLKEGTVDDMLTELKEQMNIKFRGCLCEYCKNITLKMKSLNRVCDLQLQQDCKVKYMYMTW